MDYHPKNLKKKNSNILEKFYKKSKKLSECSSKINVEHNMNRDFDNKTLNLFKGIVKITNVQSNNLKKSPIIKSNSASVKNIINYTNTLYKNEEHLQKNHIDIVKNFENNILQETPIKTFSHKFSMNENCEKSISSVMIPHISKEKNYNNCEKKFIQKKFM